MNPAPALIRSFPLRTAVILIAAVLMLAPLRARAEVAAATSAQERATELIEAGFTFYRNGGDAQKFGAQFLPGVAVTGNNDVLENCLRAASALLPDRLDLRFGVASTLIFQGKVADALAIYQDIARRDPAGFAAPILYAAFSRAQGDQAAFDETINGLRSTHPAQTRAYLEKFARLDRILEVPLSITPAQNLPQEGHAIVVLGYGLAKDGTMRPALVRRLEKALELARLYPKSALILTGGVPQSGVTEAYMMSRWLLEKGIAGDRLHLEDQARDTLGNANYSVTIVQALGATHVTLVSSATHIRRGLADLEETAASRGLELHYDHLAELDTPTLAEAQKISPAERIAVYRDMLRASGLWAYPGIQP